MNFIASALALLAIVGGAVSAAVLTPSPQASPPEAKPAKISAVLHPAEVTEMGRSPVPLMRLPKAPAPEIATLTAPVEAPTESRRMTEDSARAAIERDGYKGASGLRCSDGRCTGQALRGQTSISITVEPDGSVRSN